MSQEWDADPEDIAAIREGLADGLIEWGDLPFNRARDFQPLVSERMQFKLLAERARRLRGLTPSQASQYRKQQEQEKKERIVAPYVAALVAVIIAAVLAFVVCYQPEDKCVQEVQTRDGVECVEYESDLRP